MEGDQAPVKVDSQFVSLILIRWIAIYPMDSAINLLNNRGQVHPGSESGIGKDIGNRSIQSISIDINGLSSVDIGNRKQSVNPSLSIVID